VWALNIPGGFSYVARATIITLLIIGAVSAGETWLPRLFNRLSGLDAALLERYPLMVTRANRYIPVLRRGVVYAIRIAAFLLILAAWRVDVQGILFGDTGRDLLGRFADIAIVLVIALISWEIASGLITAHLDRRDPTGSAVIRSARIRTLLPLARNALLIVISLMATLIILSEVGVDIAPLLAGAGVVGLAIGFGAQSLVKDVITGAFFMFEGTINIGDVVDLGGKAGQVESMNIRSIRLRDYNGNLHTVNFGSVGMVTNMTRDFSYFLSDVKVAYRYDVDDVIAVLHATDEEVRKDERFKYDILEPIEIAGVEMFADTTFVIRSRIKTRPIRQWDVGREFNRRLKLNLEAKGIQQAVPGLPAHVVVSDDDRKDNIKIAAAVGSRRRAPDR
jgi:moderate conductance mechanosensitive channel